MAALNPQIPREGHEGRVGGTDFTAHTWAEHMARQSSHSGGKTDAGAGRWEKKKKGQR